MLELTIKSIPKNQILSKQKPEGKFNFFTLVDQEARDLSN